jgi:hypothetical protein
VKAKTKEKIILYPSGAFMAAATLAGLIINTGVGTTQTTDVLILASAVLLFFTFRFLVITSIDANEKKKRSESGIDLEPGDYGYIAKKHKLG